jgi:hypothetical protein
VGLFCRAAEVYSLAAWQAWRQARLLRQKVYRQTAGQVYVLMEGEHDPRRDGQTGFRKFAGDNFIKVMTVTGTETSVNGIKAIYVQGYVGQ